MLQAGQLVGNYRITRLIGEGGMGLVYHASHQFIGRQAAIKILRPELATNAEHIRRFLNEARAVNLVAHPGLVEIFEYGLLPDGTPHIVMEYLRGELLSDRLRRSRGPLRMATTVGLKIALAMAAAHEGGIVHRDLKPHNVFLIADADHPDRESIKIIDFGVAKLAPAAVADQGDVGVGAPSVPRTLSGAVLGTPEYMAPEQCLGAGQATSKADVYALGIMLYEMLSGRRPFVSDLPSDVMTLQVRSTPVPLKDLVPDLPADLIALVHRMLSKRPADRPTMGQVAERLQSLCAQERAPQAADPTTLSEAGGSSAVAPRSTLGAVPTQPLRIMLSAALLVIAASVAAVKVWYGSGRSAGLGTPRGHAAVQAPVHPAVSPASSLPARAAAPSPPTQTQSIIDATTGDRAQPELKRASSPALRSAPPLPSSAAPSASGSASTPRRSADLVVPLFKAKPPQPPRIP